MTAYVLYPGRAKMFQQTDGTGSAPMFKGRLALSEDLKAGSEVEFALWFNQSSPQFFTGTNKVV